MCGISQKTKLRSVSGPKKLAQKWQFLTPRFFLTRISPTPQKCSNDSMSSPEEKDPMDALREIGTRVSDIGARCGQRGRFWAWSTFKICDHLVTNFLRVGFGESKKFECS